MRTFDDHASLADLADSGVRLRPAEAVAIVRGLLLQVVRGDLPGVPSAPVIRLTADGDVLVEGPVAAGGTGVSRGAHLLDAVLACGGASPETRVPGALRLVIARALGTLDLPPYPSLEAFADALTRFAGADVAAIARELHSARSASVRAQALASESEAPADVTPPADDDNALTVSDIRRARRSTRLSLAEVSEHSHIPAWLLRELEWGYVRNWPGGLYGRTQLVRYARAAGLDERLVVRTVWPLIEDAARARGTIVVSPDDVQPADPQETTAAAMLVPIKRGPRVPLVTHTRTSRQHRMAAAIAIPALLSIALLPALMDRADRAAAPPSAPSPVAKPAATPQTPPTRTADTQVAPAADVRDVLATVATPRVLQAAGFSPSFAAVGSAMFYHVEGQHGSALVRADAGGAAEAPRITRVIDDNARNYHARPSPDGTRIAFDSDREGERAVYIADADGRNVRRVSGDGFAAVPTWSPDGERLAFVRSEPGNDRVWNLWSVDLDSRETRRLTSHRVGQPWGGSWFPDGRRLAYSHERSLVILDTQTGRQQVFASPVPRRLLRTPAVSPDGRLVIFQVHRDGAWLLNVSDGSTRRVLADPTAEEYTWAPDGRRVAYHSRRDGHWGVWVMAAR